MFFKANVEIAKNKACDTSNAKQLNQSNSETFGSTSKLMLTDENETSDSNINLTSIDSNDDFAKETQSSDEPLNLTVKKNIETDVIDPTSGALDLSMKSI